jgi:hypothetical protein
MNIKKLLLICLSALSISAFAQSHEGLGYGWTFVTESNAGTKLYINTNTLERNGDIAKIWTATIAERENHYDKSLTEIRCKAKEARSRTVVIYKNNEFKDIKSNHNLPNSEWHSVIPDTLNDLVRIISCGKK